MRKIRVLGVTEDTRYLAGGRLAFFKLMQAVASAGAEVNVVSSFGATQSHFTQSDPPTLRVSVPRRRIIGPLVFFLRLLIVLPGMLATSDVVVVNSGYTVPVTVVLAKLMGKKVVVLQHDAHRVEFLQRMASTPSRRVTAVFRWIMSYPPLRIVDAVLCISETTRLGLLSMGIATKSRVIGNVVE
ncbi:MAG: glycosyltransferase [Candidatus Marsarchaeota archaeon]|nr:glycosyltransferase [Candidatus Marsarchaeota archaeon]